LNKPPTPASDPQPSSPKDGSKDGSERERNEDWGLVQRCQRGEASAFAELVRRYQRKAYSLAFGMVHNPDDARDVVQDAFVKVHRHLPNFKGDSSFYTWFYRIVVNVAIDHVRKHSRSAAVDYDDTVAHEADGPGDGELLPSTLGVNPATALGRREIREAITKALETLSPNHRAVLLMRESEGLSYEEMAEAMECSKGTIMSRLFHARKNMQKVLTELLGGSHYKVS
jgi:RNA polymerase sigma-70 factor, ECF subfamily